MAKKEKQKNNNANKKSFNKNVSPVNKLKTETKHTISAILFFVFSLFLLMSMPVFNIGGIAGKNIYEFLDYFFGIGYILLPILFVLVGISFLKSETPNIGWTRAISGMMFLLSGLGMIDVASLNHSGGLLGRILSTPFVSLFDVYASIVFLGAILIISILVMFDTKPDLAPFLKNIWNIIIRKREKPIDTLNANEIKEVEKVEEKKDPHPNLPLNKGEEKGRGVFDFSKKDENEEEDLPIKKRKGGLISTYVPPPLNLLEEDKGG